MVLLARFFAGCFWRTLRGSLEWKGPFTERMWNWDWTMTVTVNPGKSRVEACAAYD